MKPNMAFRFLGSCLVSLAEVASGAAAMALDREFPSATGEITVAIETIREKLSGARRIVLQAVVGGPDRDPCHTGGGLLVRASWKPAHIDNAIAAVVGARFGTDPEVVPGFSPMVRTCDDYGDSLGHLTSAGAVVAGQTIGEYYRSVDGSCHQ